MDSTLYVKTLGGFSLKHICTEDQNLEITEQDSNSWRQWAFLEYLCVYHQRCVSQEEIIDIIWGGVEVGNPVNTLKTLLHRAEPSFHTRKHTFYEITDDFLCPPTRYLVYL